MMMSKEQLIEAAYDVAGGKVEDCSLDRLFLLVTVTQFVTDLCPNEIERRGEPTYSRDDGRAIIPYQSNYALLTILKEGSDELNRIGGRHQRPVAPVSVDDFELLVAQTFGFTAQMLGILPHQTRPNTIITKMAAILTDTPENVLKLAETEIRSWRQDMGDC